MQLINCIDSIIEFFLNLILPALDFRIIDLYLYVYTFKWETLLHRVRHRVRRSRGGSDDGLQKDEIPPWRIAEVDVWIGIVWVIAQHEETPSGSESIYGETILVTVVINSKSAK